MLFIYKSTLYAFSTFSPKRNEKNVGEKKKKEEKEEKNLLPFLLIFSNSSSLSEDLILNLEDFATASSFG